MLYRSLAIYIMSELTFGRGDKALCLWQRNYSSLAAAAASSLSLFISAFISFAASLMSALVMGTSSSSSLLLIISLLRPSRGELERTMRVVVAAEWAQAMDREEGAMLPGLNAWADARISVHMVVAARMTVN
jgi:CBS domain containing-hemolysin-like protein